MAEILGAIAASDQLVKTFASLYNKMNKACQTIRHAKKEVREVSGRTRAMERLWTIYRETMKDVNNIAEFQVDFERYKKFDRGLRKHSQCVIDKIRSILAILHPLLTARKVSVWTGFRTRWKWLIRRKEELRLLYVDMQLLTGYMKTFINLVLLQVALRKYELEKSAATKVQVDSLGRALRAELRRVRRTQRTQLYTSSIFQEKEKVDFLLEVRKTVKRELAKTPRSSRSNTEDYSSSDSSPDSSSESSSVSGSDSYGGIGPGPTPRPGPFPTGTAAPTSRHYTNISHSHSLSSTPDPDWSFPTRITQGNKGKSSSDADPSSESSASSPHPPGITSTQPKGPRRRATGPRSLHSLDRHSPDRDIQPISKPLAQPSASVKNPPNKHLGGPSTYSASSDPNTASTLAVITATLQSTKSLCETVRRFQDRNKTLRRLLKELEDLINILDLLKQVISTETTMLILLEGPLDHCSQVCHQFEELMKAFSKKSKTGFLDWTKMEFMKGDINEFIDTISGYKSSISVGLGTVTIHGSKVSEQVLHEYNEILKDTAYNLEIRLQQIDEKIARLTVESKGSPNINIDLDGEREVTKQCLQICEDAKTYMESLANREPSLIREAPRATAEEETPKSFEAQLLTRRAPNGSRDDFTNIINRLSSSPLLPKETISNKGSMPEAYLRPPATSSPWTSDFKRPIDGAHWRAPRLMDAGISQQELSDGSALAAAVRIGNEYTIRRLIMYGADPNTHIKHETHGSALAVAAGCGNIEPAKILLEAGADVNLKLKYGDYGSALSAAARFGQTEIMNYLIDKGADVNMPLDNGIYGNALTAASCYLGTESLSLLLSREADPNIQLQYGEFGSALAAACYQKNFDNVDLLLLSGADPNLRLSHGGYGNAILIAIDIQDVLIIDKLLRSGAVLGNISGPVLALRFSSEPRFKKAIQHYGGACELIISQNTFPGALEHNHNQLSDDSLSLNSHDAIEARLFNMGTLVKRESTVELSTVYDVLQSSQNLLGLNLLGKITRCFGCRQKQYLDETVSLIIVETQLYLMCNETRRDIKDIFDWICLAVTYSVGYSTSRTKEMIIIPPPDGGTVTDNPWIISSKFDLSNQQFIPVPDEAGYCWINLFECSFKLSMPKTQDSTDYQQKGRCQGLELDFSHMIRLAAVEYPVPVGAGIILMGYSTALVPIQETADGMIRWHLEIANHNAQFKTSELQATKHDWLQTQNMDYLQSRRPLLGWCMQAKILLGTNKLNPKVVRSTAKSKPTTWHWKGANLQALAQSAAPIQIGGQVGLSFDRISNFIRFNRSQNYLLCLESTAREPIILYDVSAKRAWLVPLLSVFHHMILAYCDFVGKDSLENQPPTAIPSSESPRISTETLRDKGGMILQKAGEDSLTVRDLIMKFSLSTAQISLQGPRGSDIFGYEFMDIVTEPTRSVLKKVRLEKNGLAWASLLSEVNCLFCSGLGEAIVGSRALDLSSPCNSLPSGSDLLAASMQSIQNISERYGVGTNYRCYRLSDSHFWQLSGPAFQNCQHIGQDSCWSCPEFLQEIRTSQPVPDLNGQYLSTVENHNAALVFGAPTKTKLSIVSARFKDLYQLRSNTAYKTTPRSHLESSIPTVRTE